MFLSRANILTMQERSQYSAASKVPLIKSPSLRTPWPIELPSDIHPLPESVLPYFVYPFTLEPHVITVESSRRTTLAAHAARRHAYLRNREDQKARRTRDALRRIAPGFEPQATPLVPVKKDLNETAHVREPNAPKSVMEDLVDQLAALDYMSSVPHI